MTGPWDEKWKVRSEFGGGGQGTTFIVSAEDTCQEAVLKILKHQDKEEARRRMFREVSSLKTLHVAGCKVPQVLDGNTEQFEDKNVPLYFVMELIKGEKLSDLLRRTQGLGLERAIGVTLDLCMTIEKALKEDVIHRGLKPDNLIVRNLESNDMVIVDYGLSFNAKEDDDVTHASETLDNKFLSLSERRVPGGNRRDARSELTGACAVLYYCITGKPPVDLVGPDGRPPHRRQGSSLREKLGEIPSVRQLEVLLDKGFSPNIDSRFQTVQELVSRIQEILHPAARVVHEDPKVVAHRSAELLLKHNRATQIAQYKKAAETLGNYLERVRKAYASLSSYSLHGGGICMKFDAPGTDDVGVSYGAQLLLEAVPNKLLIQYNIGAKGDQCGVFRGIYHLTPPDFRAWTQVGIWEAILWYDGLTTPDGDAISQDFAATINEAIGILEREVLGTSPGQ